MSVSSFGSYSLAFVLVGFATTFGFSWSSSSIIFFGSKERAETGSINKSFWARNIILLGSLLIITFIFLTSRHWVDSYINNKVSWLIYLWVLARVVEDYFFHYFLAIKKQLLGSVMMFASKVIFLGMVLLIPLSVQKLISLNILSSGLAILYIFGINKKDIGSFEFDKDAFKTVLNFSLWQLFGFSGLYIINFGDNIVIKYFMTTVDVGVYNASYKLFDGIANLSNIVLAYFASIVTVAVAIKDSKKIYEIFFKDRYWIISVAMVIHLLMIVFSKVIVLTIFGEEYSGAVNSLRVLLVGSAINYFFVFYRLFYNTTNRYKALQVTNIARSIINIVLDVPLVMCYGIIGAAYATTISIIITFIFSWGYCERKIKTIAK